MSDNLDARRYHCFSVRLRSDSWRTASALSISSSFGLRPSFLVSCLMTRSRWRFSSRPIMSLRVLDLLGSSWGRGERGIASRSTRPRCQLTMADCWCRRRGALLHERTGASTDDTRARKLALSNGRLPDGAGSPRQAPPRNEQSERGRRLSSRGCAKAQVDWSLRRSGRPSSAKGLEHQPAARHRLSSGS